MFEDLIKKTAEAYGLEWTWIKAIVTQESNFNPYALRYEPRYMYLYKVPIFAHKLGISEDTEMMTQKMSFGLGQVMLALAREQGFEKEAGLLFDPEINLDQVCKRIYTLKHRALDTPDDVFAGYNGGPGAMVRRGEIFSNQGYVDSVKRHLKTITA